MTKEFFDLVVKMREAQKAYFKTRMSHSLDDAKKLEKEVDRQIKALTETKDIEQNKLF